MATDEIEWLIDWDPSSNVCPPCPLGDEELINSQETGCGFHVLLSSLSTVCVQDRCHIQELTARPSLRLSIMASKDRQVR